jgi:hypothetical protein
LPSEWFIIGLSGPPVKADVSGGILFLRYQYPAYAKTPDKRKTGRKIFTARPAQEKPSW